MVYLQHGGVYYCRRNDVIVTPCIDSAPLIVTQSRNLAYARDDSEVIPFTVSAIAIL